MNSRSKRLPQSRLLRETYSMIQPFKPRAMSLKQNLLPQDGEAYLVENIFDFDRSLIWKHEPIKIFGKLVMQPRLTAWHGDPDKIYKYSTVTMIPQAWTQDLSKIKSQVEAMANTKFTNALLNLYRNGQDSMGWHADDERELGRNPVIASVSFGETRIFQMRHLQLTDLKLNIELKNGSLLIMKGETQHHWQHCLPKTKSFNGLRINITFRKII
jgi:alkylated DNA repair dioxygenase AlkB